MEPTNQSLPEVEVDAKYFEVTVPARDGYTGALPKQLCVNFELDVPRQKYQELEAASNLLPKRSNKGKHLMIFGDQSGSMSGKPFAVLKAGCIDVARHLFDDDEDVSLQPFERVHMIFYASYIERQVVTAMKEKYLAKINEEFHWGGTCFTPCFDHIKTVIENAQNDSSYDIIFLTDGCGERLEQESFKKIRQDMVDTIKKAKEERGVKTTMYAIGFSEYHDAQLLNFIAQAGSEMGDFIYIDFNSPVPYEHLLADAFASCVGRAMSQGLQFEAIDTAKNFNMNLKLARQFQFAEDVAVEADASSFCFYINSKGQSVWGPAKPQIDVDAIPAFVDGYKDNVEAEEEQPEVAQNNDTDIQLSVNIVNEDVVEAPDEWTSIKFTCSSNIDRETIESKSLEVKLSLTKQLQIKAKLNLVKNEIPLENELILGAVKLASSHSFKLTQEVQGAPDKRQKEIIDELQAISDGLPPIFERIQKIKDRIQRKAIMTAFQGCQSTVSGVIKILREYEGKGALPNNILAQLNSLAFAALKSGQLNKLLDKRATQNFELYQKFDNEISEIVGKLKPQHLEAKYRRIADDVGVCPLALTDAIECCLTADCLAIGLKIRRPEAAIADPSRVIIDDIFPTYVSTESFLESAKFKLQNDGPDAIGGFKPTGANKVADAKPKAAVNPAVGHTGKLTEEEQEAADQAAAAAQNLEEKQRSAFVMKGLGNELITGALPLYLFPEHWAIARRKMGPILGLAATLDIMGFSFEQYMTIPYLVLMKAAQKAKDQPTESNLRMLAQVKETCYHQLAGSVALRDSIAKAAFDFVRQPDEEPEEEKKDAEKKEKAKKKSHRTQDVTKNVTVLLAQFAVLCQIDNFAADLTNDEVRQVFSNEEQRSQLIRDFVRYATEENMRRQINDADHIMANLIPLLFTDQQHFITEIVDRRRAECIQISLPSDVQAFYASLQETSQAIKGKFGYGDGATKDVEFKIKKSEKKYGTNIDMKREIEKAVEGNQLGSAEEAQQQLTGANKKFKKYHRSFIAFANNLLEGKPLDSNDGRFTDLFNMPYLDELTTEEEQQLIILALILQNAHHQKNPKRVEAVVNDKYVDIKTAAEAVKYCEKILTDELFKNVTKQFDEIQKEFEEGESSTQVRLALEAPDFFTALALLQKAGLSYGKGDFKRALEVLADQKSPTFKDVAKKLIILKNGCLFKKGTVNEDAAAPQERMTPDMLNSKDSFQIYADKKSNVAKKTDHSVNSKLVFRVWAKQVYDEEKREVDTDASSLTQAQIENIFPEFAHKLQLYAKCCDEKGRIVKNTEYYATYKSKMHDYSRRGGLKKDSKQRDVRKQHSDKKKADKK